MLILSWMPSGGCGRALPKPASVAGAQLASTTSAVTDLAVRPVDAVTPPSAGSIPSPRRRSAARRRRTRAARSSSSATAPMPPTGTFHSPVPLPITW